MWVCPVFRIRIHFFDTDPDPAFEAEYRSESGSNPDQGFWWPKIEEKKFRAKKNLIFFTTVYLSLGFQKGRPSYRRSLYPSKENIQHFKTWIFFIFFSSIVGHFCPPGSGSDPDSESRSSDHIESGSETVGVSSSLSAGGELSRVVNFELIVGAPGHKASGRPVAGQDLVRVSCQLVQRRPTAPGIPHPAEQTKIFLSNIRVLRIWDVYSGSELFHPGSRAKKIPVTQIRTRIRVNPERDLDFLPIPDPRSWG